VFNKDTVYSWIDVHLVGHLKSLRLNIKPNNISKYHKLVIEYNSRLGYPAEFLSHPSSGKLKGDIPVFFDFNKNVPFLSNFF